ncbi:hypothetical protein BDW67DRAFT_152044 [Aspergillus spinulosporus]
MVEVAFDHTVCHATVFSYYASSENNPTAGLERVKCGLWREGASRLRAEDEETWICSHNWYVQQKVHLSGMPQPLSKLHCDLSNLIPYRGTHPTSSCSETNSPENVSHKSFDPLTSARTPLSPVSSRLALPMSQSDCQISQSADEFPSKLNPMMPSNRNGVSGNPRIPH